MPRPLVIGNGSLLVTFDADLSIRDLYWPRVGLVNHVSGQRCRIGVRVDGFFSWLSDPAWHRQLGYLEDSLETRAVFTHPDLGIELLIQDSVLHRSDILLRRFVVRNLRDEERPLQLFLHHDLSIAETDIGDTALYNPFTDSVIHYKRDFFFLIGGRSAEGGLAQYAMGIKGFQGAEGTWRDAEDGTLSMNAVAQGSVDSTICLTLALPANRTAEAHGWLCCAHSMEAVEGLRQNVVEQGFDRLMADTSRYWRAWSASSVPGLESLPAPVAQLFRRCLLVIRTNIDNGGAVIAANDSDIMQTARAHYSYMWPRDGALVCEVLDRLGYQDITRRFFSFCARLLPRQRAVLMHKYTADGSLGATWHPWITGGHKEVPFQEDGTALVIWALHKHYTRYRDIEFIESLYRPFVQRSADFIADYRDPHTGLPLPSYDLWEERRGVHAYTCGTVFGALMAAAALSDVFDDDRAEEYREAARQVREGMAQHLWDEEAGRFARRLVPHGPCAAATYDRDLTIDSALSAVWAFGAFAPDDPRVEQTMRKVVSRLWVKTGIGGLARYEGDYYFRRVDDTDRVPGNPWPICTLWAAQWYIAHAASDGALATALELLLWAARHALESGAMPEQVHPETGEPLSVAPLTWSHAEFVATVLNYLEKKQSLS